MKKKNYFSKVKEVGRLCLLTSALVVSSSLAAQDVTTGLKVHYTFESVSGGIVTDDSGNGYSGSAMGSATAVPGYSGQGMNFAAQADYIQLPNEITSSLNDFTIATWVNLDQVNTWSRIFDFGTGTAVNMFLTPSSGSSIRYAITTGGAGGEQQINGSTALVAGAWVHVAVTLNGTVGTLYVNGVAVGTNPNMTFTPSALGATTQNYIAKSQYPDPTLAGVVDDFRIYSRALTSDDILTLIGYPSELVTQWKNLKLTQYSELAEVTGNISLPTTLGSNGVTVSWTSSNQSVISNTGVVTRPDQYNEKIKLTASVKLTTGEKTDSLTKDFTATVIATNAASALIADWDFSTANITLDGDTIKVKDSSGSDFVGKLIDVAKIRTIGSSTQYNVLDLGNNQGYFDMGTGIGKAVYALSDYTIGAYFRIDNSYTGLDSWGNLLWNFSNSENCYTDPKGTMYAGLKNQNAQITPTGWNAGGEQGFGIGANAGKGAWHHFAYTQSGTVGTIYIDGVAQRTGSITWLPSEKLRREGSTGTLYNWIGRPIYSGDVYLRNTLVYGFQMYNEALTADDMVNLGITGVITNLDNAYAENPNYQPTEINTEMNNLSLGDLTAVTSNITLPTHGVLDPTILISWKSSCPQIISNTGVVTRPDYYNFNVTLTATLTKGYQQVTKSFPATVVVKAGSQFTSDLLVNYDFSQVSDSVVTDAAEKHFTGKVKNEAKIRTIGNTGNQFNVLDLGNGTGYFDMGTDMGKVIYHLNDYTMGAYFRIDDSYAEIDSWGNLLWNFSNSTNAVADPKGTMYAGLKNQNVQITSTWYGNGEQGVGLGANAAKGTWTYFAYTQKDTIGTIYVNGSVAATGTVKTLPSTAMPKDGFVGTICNWIGRPIYGNDVYLRNTLVYGFHLNNSALSEEALAAKANVTVDLNNAYIANPGTSAVTRIAIDNFRIITEQGMIRVSGLTENDKVSVFDMMGRKVTVKNAETISVAEGIYIVKINDIVRKVIVK